MTTCPLANPSQLFVLIVEPSSSLRHIYLDTFRSLGAKKVVGTSCGKDALQILENEKPNWIITSLNSSDPINAMQILKLCSSHPKLRGTQVSFFLEIPKEEFCLSLAFELGLLSWHEKPLNKANLNSEISDLLTILRTKKWEMPLATAEYIRAYLALRKDSLSRLALEQSLLAMYPGSPEVLLSLAEAEYLNGRVEKRDLLMRQAALIDPTIKLPAEFNDSKAPQSARPENVFGLRRVVVVDCDTTVLNLVSTMLQELGVRNIEVFEDGTLAWNWINKNPEFDLLTRIRQI